MKTNASMTKSYRTFIIN